MINIVNELKACGLFITIFNRGGRLNLSHFSTLLGINQNLNRIYNIKFCL